MIPKGFYQRWKMVYGVLYCVVYSNDHFNPVWFLFEWKWFLDPSFFKATPPLPPLTTELCYCCLRLTFYSLTFWGNSINGYFIWLLPCKKSLNLRYRFDFSKKKKVFICILYSIKECLELSSSNVDVAIITPFYDFVREFTVWKLVCIFV